MWRINNGSQLMSGSGSHIGPGAATLLTLKWQMLSLVLTANLAILRAAQKNKTFIGVISSVWLERNTLFLFPFFHVMHLMRFCHLFLCCTYWLVRANFPIKDDKALSLNLEWRPYILLVHSFIMVIKLLLSQLSAYVSQCTFLSDIFPALAHSSIC